jgi:Ankyrin repeat
MLDYLNLVSDCIPFFVFSSATNKIAPLAPQLVNAKRPDGLTPLHLAVMNGNMKTAAALIDAVRMSMVSAMMLANNSSRKTGYMLSCNVLMFRREFRVSPDVRCS